MQKVTERISALRAEMERNGLSAYLIPSSDPHMGEYVPDFWQARSYFSGFTGSAGTLAVLRDRCGLWTDGRYFIQAEHQLAGSGIELFRMGVRGVPACSEFLAESLRKGDTAGFDGRMLSAADVESMKEKFEEKGIGVRSADLITPLWKNRPLPPATAVYLHGDEYAGLSCAQKLGQVRAGLKKDGADCQIYSRLECVAWLCNIRASDIEYTPVAVSYAAVFMDRAVLFLDAPRLRPGVREYLEKNGVTLREYGEIEPFLKNLTGEKTVLVDPEGTNYELYRILKENPSCKVKKGADLVIGLKAVKNRTEIENFRKAHVRDGCAMAEFCADLEKRLKQGETVTECTVCDLLREARARQENNRGESFATIAAYRENAAMMHYSPKPDTCKTLEQSGLLLIDSGGQYPEGTTDITRTFALGPVTQEEKKHYTWVLKAHIALATAVFLEGTTGGNLDMVCRGQIQKHGIDYRCGTGHGVGMFGGVHEGPQSIRTKNDVILRSGMNVTNEPGIYEEGKHGIRTENLMLVTDAMENEYGRFLRFEILTCFPIDKEPILPELLTKEEIAWLNEYHSRVYRTLSPLLSSETLEWLRKKTLPLITK
ncbi:aminopeptidase P family protein [Caproicibacter sp. BJN0012]|uniref:aminopeptidase P family protein n=1 Tax=Caproicibacter sp. BJN0012 TaxID=3110227 RepID=UPI002E0FFA70